MKERLPEQGFEFIDHTADAGLKAYGKTIEELFENAAAGMFSLITELHAVTGKETEEVAVEAYEYDELLKNWLSELLYLQALKHSLYKKFKVKISDSGEGMKMLEGTAEGEKFDPEKNSISTDIKTVTYHGLYVEEKKGYWEAQVIFDI